MKSFLFVITLLVSLLVVIGTAYSQQFLSEGAKAEHSASINANQELARAVLSETGIAERYDLYLGNAMDLATSPEMARNTQFVAWLNELTVQEAGWKYVEAQYIDRLNSHFSEAELTALLELAKQPLMQKWIQFEVESYLGSVEERRRLLFLLWENYNNAVFTPPPEALP
ncbi:hypothetical protein NDI52_29770 [Leptolyngbya sp. PL-A3]